AVYEDVEVVTTGNPRFDPYLDQQLADALYPSRSELAAEYGLPVEKPWVLFALDFPLLFKSDERRQQLHEMGQITRAEVQSMQKVYETFGAWLRQFIREHSECALILRPHPGSDLEQIKADQRIEGSPNVHYIEDLSINPWILHADRYVTRSSTSIVEAWLADVPAAMMCTDQFADDMAARPHVEENGVCLDSYAEFRDFLSSGLESRVRRAHGTFLTDHYYKLDGRAVFRTAKTLRQIVGERQRSPSFQPHPLQDMGEHVKYSIKALLNETGLNKFNPFDRPNDEFVSQRATRKAIDEMAKIVG
ncbi:MAG: hypothetical protein ABEN55_14155, partial [Bradymonadaceae bacterium]